MDKKVSVQYYYMISVYLIEYSETYREFKKSDPDYQQGVYVLGGQSTRCKVALLLEDVVHTSMRCEVTTRIQAPLTTSCIVTLFNSTELWSVAIHSRFSQMNNIGNNGNVVICVFPYTCSFLLYSNCIVLVKCKIKYHSVLENYISRLDTLVV